MAGRAVAHAHAHVQAVPGPTRAPDEVVGRVGGQGGVLVHLRERVLEAAPRRDHGAEDDGQPQAPVVRVDRGVLAVVRHHRRRYPALAVIAGHEVQHLVGQDEGASRARVLAPQPRVHEAEIGELQERTDELDPVLGSGRERHGGGPDPHRVPVRELERVPLREDVAAASVHAGDGQLLQRSHRAEVDGGGRALGTQVPVPDHLREADGHGEAAGLDAEGVDRAQAHPGQVQARVARLVVVAQERQRGHPRRGVGVVVGAVVEISAQADLEPLRVELAARLEPDEAAALGHERDLVRPLLPADAVQVEGAAGLLLLVDGRWGLLGAGDGGQGQQYRHGQGTEHFTSRLASARTGGSASLAAGYARPVPV